MITNKKRKAIPNVFWAGVLISFCVLLGCEDKKVVSHTSEIKEVKNDLVFIGSSGGLPTTGQWRQGIDFFDMNQDGQLDILAPPPRTTPQPNGTSIPFIWYGNGKGEWFQADIEVPADKIKYTYGGISGRDFDGDGIPDMALAMHGIGVRVLKGKGHGKYEDFSKGLYDRNFKSRALLADDFDRDGRLDIAAMSEFKFSDDFATPYGVAMISLAPDGWKFRYIADEEAVNGLAADQLTVGDVNGDGNPDIAVASLNSKMDLVIWINDGKGEFREFNDGLPKEKIYLSVALSDLNRDGKDDLVASISGFGKKGFVGLKAFLAGPEGFEDFSEGLPTSEIFEAINACDLDNDRNIEIIGGTQKGGIKIYSLKGQKWAEIKVDGLPKEGLERISGIYCVDVNGDSYSDIAVNYAKSGTKEGGVQVFLNVPRSDS